MAVSSFDMFELVRHIGIHVKGCYATRVTRYPDSVAIVNIVRLGSSGDISPNPGSDHTGGKKPEWKFPCVVCERPVRCNQKGILCDGCGKWYHIKCIDMDLETNVAPSHSQDQWFCGGKNCGLPFNFSKSLFESSFSSNTFGSAFDNLYATPSSSSLFSQRFSEMFAFKCPLYKKQD